jgi:quercetin dioxygenase-like cupin family protein
MTQVDERHEQLWFLGNLITVQVSREQSGGRYALLESLGAEGDGPPLHVHEREDEVFHVISGELSLVVDGRPRRLGAGMTAFAPRGVPHTYRVESETARWLVLTAPGEFESFVRAASRPAEAPTLPPQTEPSPEQVAELAQLGVEHGIELLV